MSKRGRTKRIKLGPCCLICGSSSARLVRDHDHLTNKVRGTLCDQCNGRLGAYELNQRRAVKCGKVSFKLWVETYQEQIEAHLKRDTGEFYYGPKHIRFRKANKGVKVRIQRPKKPNSFKTFCDGILSGELYADFQAS